MTHPGPPRFVVVGDAVELAPRDPDPDGAYRWRVADAPPASTVELGDAPVLDFQPDAAGTYGLELRAPDGVYRQRVRAFPEEFEALGVEEEGYSGEGREPIPADAGEPRDRQPVSARAEEEEGDPGRPRIRLDADVVGDAVVVEADSRPHPHSDERPSDLDVEFLLDDRDDLRAEDVAVDGHELRIPRDRLPGSARIHAVAVGRHGYSVADAIEIDRDGGIEVRHLYDPPEWALDSVIYEIYVRTFGDEGSAFDAIRDRLDYLADLGVDVLWLTPVLENDHAPHGYNITDFFSIASDLGTRAEYEALVEAAHERGMRVLFDLVLNHSARAHPYFRDAYGDEESPYREYYEWQESGEPATYFDWEYIANFDFSSLAVRRHLLDVIDEWAPLVDGFRCDMAWAVPDGFWRELRDRVKAMDGEFLLLDETIPYIADFQEGMFDVHFDSTTAFTLREVGKGDRPAGEVVAAVEERAEVGFPDHAGFMLYAENHDESRYVVECGEDAVGAAAGALATLPGTPMIYAGQEIGQRGRRDPIAWDHARPEIRERYERVLELRRAEPALAHRAGFDPVAFEVIEGDEDALVAYRREATDADEGERDALVVVLNFAGEPATVAVDRPVEPTDLVSGEDVNASGGVRVEDVVVLPADGA